MTDADQIDRMASAVLAVADLDAGHHLGYEASVAFVDKPCTDVMVALACMIAGLMLTAPEGPMRLAIPDVIAELAARVYEMQGETLH